MTSVPTIVSIQSSVVFGHVGNSAAVFPLLRLGFETWPIATVLLSNHTGYPTWHGRASRAGDVLDLVRGLDELGVLGRVDAILIGYLGTTEIGWAVLDAITLIRDRNPNALVCCDPVMGDAGRGVFVRPGVPEFIAEQLVPRSGILTPNQFELEKLTGRRVGTLTSVIEAAETLRARGPETILVTSVESQDLEPGALGLLAVSASGTWLVTTPRLDFPFHGAGDLTAALFLAHLLRGGAVDEALGRTAASVFSVLAATEASGGPELALVAAQDELLAPSRSFPVTRPRS